MWLLAATSASAVADADVVILGSDAEVADTLQGYLDNALADCADKQEIEADRVAFAAREALDALGLFDGRVDILTGDTACDVTLTVQAGEREKVVAWTTVLEPANALATETAAQLAALTATGGEFIPADYESAKRRVLNTLREAGYLDAALQHAEVQIAPGTGATIHWLLQPGRRYRVSDLRIDQAILDPALFQRYLTFEPGAPLETSRLRESRENLVSSDYFTQVELTPLLQERDGDSLPVQITTTPAPPWSVLAGAGYSTDTGPRARLTASAPYLNRQGHSLHTGLLASPVTGEFTTNYRWPDGDPTHEWFELTAGANYEYTDSADSVARTLGLRRTSRPHSDWTRTTYTQLLDERFDVADQNGHATLLLFGVNYSYSSTIDAARPMSGRSFSVDLRGAHESLLSDSTLVQMQIQAKQIIKLPADMRLIARFEGGVTWEDAFDDLPPSLRFFTGGDGSVRGYGLDTIGTADLQGNVIGGSRLLVASVEWDVPVRAQWSAALFYDTGSAYDTSVEFNSSVGLGLRWYSPLGPIRLDLAHPLDDSGQAVRLHLSLGPDL